MLPISLLIIIYLFAEASIVLAVPMKCEFVTTQWVQGKKLKLSDREMLVSTRYGFDMIIDPVDEAVSRSILDKGTWQPELIHVMVMFIQPGQTFLNLGTQTGLEAVILGKILGNTGHLYLFEPSSVSYRILLKNIFINDLEDITHAYRVGAGESQSQGKLLTYPENTGGAQIYLQDITFDFQQRKIDIEEVSVDQVDNVLPTQAVVHFALIDVEKMEVEALLGMKEVILRSPDLIIMLEWQYQVNPRRNQQKTIRLIEWLIELKYKVYLYHPDENNKCAIGQFQIILDPLSLLQLAVSDIILAPSHIDPNKMH